VSRAHYIPRGMNGRLALIFFFSAGVASTAYADSVSPTVEQLHQKMQHLSLQRQITTCESTSKSEGLWTLQIRRQWFVDNTKAQSYDKEGHSFTLRINLTGETKRLSSPVVSKDSYVVRDAQVVARTMIAGSSVDVRRPEARFPIFSKDSEQNRMEINLPIQNGRLTLSGKMNGRGLRATITLSETNGENQNQTVLAQDVDFACKTNVDAEVHASQN
jgi:hypothetical protein